MQQRTRQFRLASTGRSNLVAPHSDNFPDPTAVADPGLRVWYSAPNGGIFISVDSLREARLVMKAIAALTGHMNAQHVGVQWFRPDQGWAEWKGSDGETIHDLPDDDLIFGRPSQYRPLVH